MKRDARDILPALRRAPAANNADLLNELKTMHQRGLFTMRSIRRSAAESSTGCRWTNT